MNDHVEIRPQPAYSDAVSKILRRAPSLFIDGRWVQSTGGSLIEVFDPSNGKKVSAFVDASDADCDLAAQSARAAFDDGRWSALPPNQRERTINRLADLIEGHIDELAEIESIDNGKPLAASRGYDLPRCVQTLRYMAGWATKIAGEHLEPANQPGGSMHAYVRREPIGVAVQIVPWNFPLMMAVQKIAPALAAGCTVILKPAEQTSLTALRLADLVAEAGFPPGTFNLVTGRGHTAGDRLVRSPLVDKVAFTGSTEVGKTINRAATDTLKRVTLELGGKSPVIVMPDVDLASAGAGAARSIFANAGQVCIAGSRLYAHRSIFDDLIGTVAEEAGKFTMGPSLDAGSLMGPLVSTEQRERVMRYIEGGRKSGASVVHGGDAPGTEGYYVNPTILIDVKPEMAVVREEIFGPVLAAQRFDDLDEVLRQANDSQYGLASTVWTRDISAMHQLAARLKSGMVWGNVSSATDVNLPFGGYKQSGLGREGGYAGIQAYLEQKSVVIAL